MRIKAGVWLMLNSTSKHELLKMFSNQTKKEKAAS